MSFTITTDYGTFVGTTLKEAQANERKGRKLAEKERARTESIREIAEIRAEAKAFRIVRFLLQQQESPRGWRFFPDGVNGPHSCNRFPGEPYCDDKLRIETGNGIGEMPIHRNTFLGYVMDGAGYCLAIALRNHDGTESIYSVGVNDGIAASVLIPGYTRNNFRLTNRAEAETASAS